VEQVTQFDIEPTIGQQPGATAAAAAVRPRSLEDAHIDDLLRIVVEKGASDLHLCAGVPPVIRVDGRLIPTNYEKATPQDTQRLMYDILTD